MKTRPYANPLTALITAAREDFKTNLLAHTLSVAVARHGGDFSISAPTAARRVLNDVHEATGIKLHGADNNTWFAEY